MVDDDDHHSVDERDEVVVVVVVVDGVDESPSPLGLGVGMEGRLFSERTRLIVRRRGYFPPSQSPRKSSVSMDQIIAPPRSMAEAKRVLMAIESTSSYPTHWRSL